MRPALLEAFTQQAAASRALGSPFTARLCEALPDALDRETATGRKVLDWDGDPSPSADSVPLRLCGGLHALVLTGADLPLIERYPPHPAPTSAELAAAIVRNDETLARFIDSPPQTNETARAGAIWPGLKTIAAETGLPVALFEVGASAGLNLRMDRFDYGEGSGGVRVAPDWTGPVPPDALPRIIGRAGCDIAPLDPTNEADALRLRAYVWADQTARMERLDAALDIALEVPATVERMDAVDWIDARVRSPTNGQVRVLFSTVAWQYLPEAHRLNGQRMIETIGAAATPDAPFAWLRMEADGEGDGAGIQLRLWNCGDAPERLLGRADFHGRWVRWLG